MRFHLPILDIHEQFRKILLTNSIDEIIIEELSAGAPYLSDQVWHWSEYEQWFTVQQISEDYLVIEDHHRYHNRKVRKENLPLDLLEDPWFNIREWYAGKIYEEDAELYDKEHSSPSDDDSDMGNKQKGVQLDRHLSPLPWSDPEPILNWLDMDDYAVEDFDGLTIAGIQVPHGMLTGLQCNAAAPQDFMRIVPKPVVVVIEVNGHPSQALLDSGSVGDFMSTTLADQLKVQKIVLAKPLPLQLAVQGSQSKVNYGTKVNIRYQNIDEEQYLDIANLSSYDIILGTPWWFQHSISVGFNPAQVLINHAVSQPIQGEGISQIA
ncbi:hypothetical protein H0H87_010449, partial [Tephrocybe sp. NHM501043]